MATYGGDNDQARVSPIEVKRKPRIDPNKTGVANIEKLLLIKNSVQQGVNIKHPEADKYANSATKKKGKISVHRPDEAKPTQKPKIVDDGKKEDLYGTGTQFTEQTVKKGDDSDEDFQLGVGRESVAHGKQSTPPRATNLVTRLKKARDPKMKWKKLNIKRLEATASTGKRDSDTKIANHKKSLLGGRGKPQIPSKKEKIGQQLEMQLEALRKAREQGDGKGVDPTGKDPWAESKAKHKKAAAYQSNLQTLSNLNTDLAKEIEETHIVNGEALNKEEWNLHQIQEARLSETRTHAMHLAMGTNCACASVEASQIEVRKNHAFPLTTAEKPGMVTRGEPSAMYSADGKALEEDPMARKIDIRDKNDSALEANTRTVENKEDSKGRITTTMKSEPTICSSLAVFNAILNKTEFDDKRVAAQGKAKKSKRNSITNTTTDTAGQQTNDTRGI